MKRLFPAFLILAAAQAADVKPGASSRDACPGGRSRRTRRGAGATGPSIDKIRSNPLAPDVQIFHNAVRYALQYNEFFKPDEIGRAKQLLRQGQERADALAGGEAPWAAATGLVVRGYVSKIDRSVQPYGLVVPPSYSPTRPHRWRLDTWFHGRSETLSEVNFLTDRAAESPGEFTPPDTIVLHLYGRYCNANKLAGEVDLFEALDAREAAIPDR